MACATGREGQGVTLRTPDDIVYAPDQPDFALNAGVTVAAWVKPDRIDGTRTIFRKRDDNNSSFALMINGNKFQFLVKLISGANVAVTAPASAGVWTHIAATYDGNAVVLYVNGVEAARTRQVGVIARGVGPLLIGNDGSKRNFQGLIDNIWFNTMAAPGSTINELTCVRQDPLVSITPQTSPAVTAGTRVDYTLTVQSRNPSQCAPDDFFTFVNTPDFSFIVDPNFDQFELKSGEKRTFPFAVRSGDETEPGNYTLTFAVQRFGLFGAVEAESSVASTTTTVSSGGNVVVVRSPGRSRRHGPPKPPPTPTPEPPPATGFVQVPAQYVIAEPTGCHISTNRELFVRHLSVVDDPKRTVLVPGDASSGAWTFGRLMERLSPSPAAAPAVTEAMLRSFLAPQVVNGFTIEPRLPMDPIVLQPWPRTADGLLDLSRAPMLLLAIVNRLDLKDLSQGKAGEGRLVYGVLDAFGNPLEFTVIFEYLLPAKTEAEYRAWEDAVHALQAKTFPSADYNAALQALTDRITSKGAFPEGPNGSALIDVRTNEISLSDVGVWQLREFHLSPSTGFLEPAPIFQTPDLSFNNTDTLAHFINANEATILTERHTVPLEFEGKRFATGAVFNNIDFWNAPGINNPEARHKFSLNTCNGCHGAETQTGFLQVQPRFFGQESSLSGFLLGETVFDPVTGTQRELGELKRRRNLLQKDICGM